MGPLAERKKVRQHGGASVRRRTGLHFKLAYRIFVRQTRTPQRSTMFHSKAITASAPTVKGFSGNKAPIKGTS